jgi:hypothetical protein
MTSATIKPARSARVEREGYGLVLSASVMLLVIGCFNLIYGIAAVANTRRLGSSPGSRSPDPRRSAAPGW